MQAKIIIFFLGKKLLNLAGEITQWLREQRAGLVSQHPHQVAHNFL